MAGISHVRFRSELIAQLSQQEALPGAVQRFISRIVGPAEITVGLQGLAIAVFEGTPSEASKGDGGCRRYGALYRVHMLRLLPVEAETRGSVRVYS